MSQYSIFNYPCVRVRMLVGVCEIFTKKNIYNYQPWFGMSIVGIDYRGEDGINGNLTTDKH